MIRVKVNNRRARQRFKLLIDASDSRQLLTETGRRIVRWIDQSFDEGGRPRRWRRHRRTTRAQRNGGRVLQDTGKLRRSFKFKVIGGKRVRISSGHPLAHLHQDGVAPHEIMPKKSQVLRFLGPKGFVFTTKVEHPGLPKRRMFPNRRIAKSIGTDVVAEAFERAARG